jgi:hypothetical protein
MKPRLCSLVLSLAMLCILLNPEPSQARRQLDQNQPVSVDVPDGWSLQNANGASFVENGQGAFVNWMKVPGGGQDYKRVYALFDQMFKQYRNFKKLDEREGYVSGSKGIVVVVGGINPKGLEVITKATAAPFGEDAWVVMLSGPVDRFQSLQPVLEAIAASVQIGKAGANAPAMGAGPLPSGVKSAPMPRPTPQSSPQPLAGGTESIPVPAAPPLSGPASNGKALPAGTYRFEPSVVPDPYGQDKPMAAATLFIPYGWRSSGGVIWSPEHACTDYYNVSWGAVSPDGTSGLGVLPQLGWEMNNTGNPRPVKIGCQRLDLQSAQAYLQAVMKKGWPGAQARNFRRLPEYEVAEKASPTAGGGSMRNRSEAGELTFAFKKDGRDMVGKISAVVGFSITRLPVQGMADLQFVNARANPGFVTFAPAGQYDHAFFERVRRSVQPNPEWIRRVIDSTLALNRIEQAGERERQKIWNNTQQEIASMRVSTWQSGQKSADQRAADFSQMIRGVEHYAGADGRKTELDSGYANAWKLKDGSYLMSSSAGFDPNRDLGIDGQRLDPVKR